MTKVEAPSLEEAYKKAALALECSVSELQCEVVQYPSGGVLGFMKKNAIIIATQDKNVKPVEKSKSTNKTKVNASHEENVASEIVSTVMDETEEEKPAYVQHNKSISNDFFDDNASNRQEDSDPVVYAELAKVIEDELKELFSHSCFEIDVIEVDVHDSIALIFIDGNDAALLIGKEGYRYNALSYMLFNWLHTKYDLFIKLEIAEFLTSQHEMIKAYIQPVIQTIEDTGRGKTGILDGILVQIALEQLRDRFPNKYVAVKTSRDGKRFVIINEFNTKFNG